MHISKLTHSVDKLRHQESLWRENLQSAGNPRTTTPTISEDAHGKESQTRSPNKTFFSKVVLVAGKKDEAYKNHIL